ncbi:MAG: dihydropteroate synthase [Flavobacteriales bacterium]
MEQQAITWRMKDRLVQPRFPLVMGIINTTPDSFLAASRATNVDEALGMAEGMLAAGAAILDIGGQSSRPGSGSGDEGEELRRLIPVIAAIHQRFPEAWISVDTWRSAVAVEAVAAGARMVNDIGAGLLDEAMLAAVARAGVPYIAMHMQGVPETMQAEPKYADVAAEVTLFLSQRLNAARKAGIADVIIDPGFGFGKTTAHNYALLHEMQRLKALGAPVLVGLSRKRMINDVLGTRPEEAINGTTALNTIALLNGASILRVHDVKEAVECVKIVGAFMADR